MSFVCPQCRTSTSLEIVSSLELSPDEDWDEISMQVVRCSVCEFSGVALDQESRRGDFNAATILHQGYAASLRDLHELALAIEKCPKPRDPQCRCMSHQSIGQQYASGAHRRWIPEGRETPIEMRFNS